jgi:hypothetical protein
MNQQYRSFLGQFVSAKEDVAQLREVMGASSMKTATLSYPTTVGQQPKAAQPKPVVAKKRA